MTSKRTAVGVWLAGVLAFAIVIYLHLPLAVPGVEGGMGEHQAAGSAAVVNDIHTAWQRAGVFDTARIAMISDLIFIGIYGVGAVLCGMYFRRAGTGLLKTLGTVIFASGLIFLLTDYGETIAQLIQLANDAGSDALAGFAAFLRPIKMVAFIVAFFGVIAALFLDRARSDTV